MKSFSRTLSYQALPCDNFSEITDDDTIKIIMIILLKKQAVGKCQHDVQINIVGSIASKGCTFCVKYIVSPLTFFLTDVKETANRK